MKSIAATPKTTENSELEVAEEDVFDDSFLKMSSPVDSEGSTPMWTPDCGECCGISSLLCVPRIPNQNLQKEYAEPTFWISQVVDAFFVGVAHSIVRHHPLLKFLISTQGLPYQMKQFYDTVVDSNIHYFIPFHDHTGLGHFLLLHIMATIYMYLIAKLITGKTRMDHFGIN